MKFLIKVCLLVACCWFSASALAAQSVNELSLKMNKLVKPLLYNPISMVIITVPSEHKANQLFQQSLFKKAYPIVAVWASRGGVRAQLEAGFMNEFGRGIKQNYEMAAKWYYLAIQPNVYNARPIARGLNYYFGANGHKKDLQKAALWFRMAAGLSYDRY